MTREQLQAAIAAFAIEPDATAFGVTNAITRAAQAEASYEDRYQLERLATGLLDHLS